MYSQGYHPKILLNGDVPKPSDFAQLGSASSNTYVATDIPPPSAASTNADMKKFVDQLAAYQKATGDSAANLNSMRLSGIRGWLAMQFLVQVATPLPNVTSSTLYAALKSAKNLQSTLIPPWTPNASGCVAGYSRVSNPYIFFTKVVNNQMVLMSTTPVNMDQYLC
jgi:hypothetical protein